MDFTLALEHPGVAMRPLVWVAQSMATMQILASTIPSIRLSTFPVELVNLSP